MVNLVSFIFPFITANQLERIRLIPNACIQTQSIQKKSKTLKTHEISETCELQSRK